MRIFMQGARGEKERLACLCEAYDKFDVTHNEEEHLVAQVLLACDPDAAIVLSDGAFGMEAVMTIRRLYPTLPLVWFSNDHAFGAQAYRLQVTFFAQKSVIESRLPVALTRAGLTGQA